MPVQATSWSPVSSATRRESPTSRPMNIAVGSHTVFTPCPRTARAQSSAGLRKSGGSGLSGFGAVGRTCGHWTATASSRMTMCSWISVVPSSSAWIGPVTVATVATRADYKRHVAAPRRGPGERERLRSGIADAGDVRRRLRRVLVIKRIVVGTDGSETASVAVQQAIELAKATGAGLDIVTAFEPATSPKLAPEERVEVPGDVQYEVTGRQEVNMVLDRAAGEAKNAGVD